MATRARSPRRRGQRELRAGPCRATPFSLVRALRRHSGPRRQGGARSGRGRAVTGGTRPARTGTLCQCPTLPWGPGEVVLDQPARRWRMRSNSCGRSRARARLASSPLMEAMVRSRSSNSSPPPCPRCDRVRGRRTVHPLHPRPTPGRWFRSAHRGASDESAGTGRTCIRPDDDDRQNSGTMSCGLRHRLLGRLSPACNGVGAGAQSSTTGHRRQQPRRMRRLCADKVIRAGTPGPPISGARPAGWPRASSTGHVATSSGSTCCTRNPAGTGKVPGRALANAMYVGNNADLGLKEPK